MTEDAVAINSLEGMSDLLAAVFDKPNDELRRHLKLPLVHRYCACGKVLAPKVQGDRCWECIKRDAWIERICVVCGESFPKQRHRLPYNKALYCSPECWGKVTGKQHGFGAHPENAGKKGQPIVIISRDITTERPAHGGGASPSEDFTADIERLKSLEAIKKGETRHLVLQGSNNSAQALLRSWRYQCKKRGTTGTGALRKGPEEGQFQIWLWIVQETIANDPA